MNTSFLYKSLLTTVLISWRLVSLAQAVPDAQIQGILEKCQTAYVHNDSSLSFKMKFLYADYDEPETVLDSLEGQVEVLGSKACVNIGNTKAVKNDSVTITIFNEDKLIYVSSPVKESNEYRPAAVFKDMLARYGGAEKRIAEKDSLTQIFLRFSDTSMYKSIVIDLDSRTNYISKIETVVRKDAADDEVSTYTLTNTSADYSVITTLYENYLLSAGEYLPELNTAQYIQKNADGEYTPSKLYQNYTIFLANPQMP